MNPSSDIGPGSPAAAAAPAADADHSPDGNWRIALMNLIASRFALIQLESKEAAHDGAKRAARFAAAALCAVFAWALLLAGGIAFISKQLGWSWSLVAIGTAILHLIAGIIFSRPPKGSGGEAFRVTRAEFQKDRAWIENLQNPKKSND